MFMHILTTTPLYHTTTTCVHGEGGFGMGSEIDRRANLPTVMQSSPVLYSN